MTATTLIAKFKTVDGFTTISFPNKKILNLPFDVKTSKRLVKDSKAIKSLFDRTANLDGVPSGSDLVPSSVSGKQYYWTAIKCLFQLMLKNDFSIEDCLRLEKIIDAPVINKIDLMEFCLENEIRQEIIQVIKFK